MTRKGSAIWEGGLKDGTGKLSTESGALAGKAYGFSSRFESQRGTNPEELIAAAHAGCFTMALSGQLAELGFAAESIATTASVTMEKLEKGWTVTKVRLDVDAEVPGIEEATFKAAAAAAKVGCPISRLLNADITMDARLKAEAHSAAR